jgi:DNA-binding NarL/FixJ family response regulator
MRVLIADDHEVVRRGVRSLLLTQRQLDICGEAVDGRDAVEKAKLLLPDLILMDISMPNLNGLEATREI